MVPEFHPGYVTPRFTYFSGLGDAASISAATGAASKLLATAGAIPSPAAPFLEIAAGVTALAGAIASMTGCGGTCIEATNFANQAAQAAQQILVTYYAIPAPRTASQQAGALQAIQQIMQQMQQACSNPALGDAGKRCISERLTPDASPPGCVNTASPGMTPGDPGIPAGSPCNFYTYYLNRIGGDTMVVSDTQAAASTVSSALTVTSPSGQSVNLLPLVLVTVAALVLWNL